MKIENCKIKIGGRRRRASRIGAVLSLELICTLPIVIVLFFAVIEFAMLLQAENQLMVAAEVACRMGTLQFPEHEQAEDAVREAARRALAQPRLVNSHELRFFPGRHSGDEVAVEIHLPMSAAAPNLLSLIGFDLRGRELVATTVMRKE